MTEQVGSSVEAAAPAQIAEPRVVEREKVDGACPQCGQEDLRRYPVLAEDGWLMVVKCQNCLACTTREPWRRLGWIELLEHSL